MREWLVKLLWGDRPKHDYDSYHYVHFTIGPSGPKAEITCTAPEGAPCRRWCNEGCETSTLHHGLNHEKVDQGFCVRTTGWFDEDPFELYSGEEAELLSGAPIKLSWEGEYFTWQFLDPYLVKESK